MKYDRFLKFLFEKMYISGEPSPPGPPALAPSEPLPLDFPPPPPRTKILEPPVYTGISASCTRFRQWLAPRGSMNAREIRSFHILRSISSHLSISCFVRSFFNIILFWNHRNPLYWYNKFHWSARDGADDYEMMECRCRLNANFWYVSPAVRMQSKIQHNIEFLIFFYRKKLQCHLI